MSTGWSTGCGMVRLRWRSAGIIIEGRFERWVDCVPYACYLWPKTTVFDTFFFPSVFVRRSGKFFFACSGKSYVLGSIMERVEHEDKDKIDWSSCNWAEITPRLLLYARKRMFGYGWRGRASGAGGSFLSPEDVVHTAIMKTISGERRWDAKRVDLFYHLLMTIRSILSNLARSGENRLVSELVGPADVFQDSTASDPARVVESRSQLSALLAYIDEKHTDLRPFIDAIIETGDFTPSELSARLGVPVQGIYNLKKRLRRALANYRNEKMEGEDVV